MSVMLMVAKRNLDSAGSFRFTKKLRMDIKVMSRKWFRKRPISKISWNKIGWEQRDLNTRKFLAMRDFLIYN